MTNSSPSIAPMRNARLACACNCAYGISTKSSDYVPPKIYDAGVGWKQPPVAFSVPSSGQPSGPRINACLVGINQDGIIAAMRGTLPPAWTVASVEDWWQDIVDSQPVAAPPLKGMVHEGFWHALQTLWPKVSQEISKLHNANPALPIYFTGHSKGGPLASIGAALLAEGTKIGPKEVVTFASPHPGDAAFAAGYPANIPVTRYENYLDLVPFLPPTDEFYKDFNSILPLWLRQDFCGWFPSICKTLENASNWDYEPLGVLQYVTSGGTTVGANNPDANVYLRLVEILAALFGSSSGAEFKEALEVKQQMKLSDSGFQRIGAAHCIACKSSAPSSPCAGGYMIGAGGEPICPAMG